MAEQPIDIHYTKLDEWLSDRQTVLMKKDAKTIKDLVATAPRLMKVARFDIPALKKQVNRYDTLSAEFSRRVTDSHDQEVQVKRKYATMLERFGLLTDSIVNATAASSSSADLNRSAAAERVAEHIDRLLDVRLAACFRELCLAGEHLAMDIVPKCFTAFTEFLAESQRMAGTEKDSLNLETSLLFPVLTRLCELKASLGIPTGDVQILLDALKAAEEGQSGENNDADTDAPPAISWGDEDDAEPTIDLGDDEGATVEIKWDDDDTTTGDVAAPDASQSTTDAQMDPTINVLSAANGIVYNSIASLLDRLEVRRALLDELDALRAFLLESSVDAAVENALTTMTRKTLHKNLVKALDDKFLSLIRDPILVELLRVKSDTPARIAFLEMLSRMHAAISGVVTKRAEYSEEAAQATERSSALEPQIKELTNEVQTLQARFEKELTRICAPRPVYIVGDINSL